MIGYKEVILEDGKYEGTVSGYTFSFVKDGTKYNTRINEGYRGMDIPAILYIKQGTEYDVKIIHE